MATNQEPYSGLEVAPTEHATHQPQIIDDPAATAPEVDPAAASPELVQDKWPLQNKPDGVHPSDKPALDDKGRQLSSDAPEKDHNPDIETLKETAAPRNTPSFAPPPISGQHKIENTYEEKPKKKRRKWLIWVLVLAVFLVILAIALGVGLGVGLNKDNNSSSKSNSSSQASSAANLPHNILNGSSFSAISLPSGDKRVFFQEAGGNIREALLTNSTGQWSSNINDVVATNAKNSTPISALLVNNTGTSLDSTGTNIYLFYITKEARLASRIFTSGTWTTRDNFSPNEQTNITFSTTQDARALAVTANTNSSAPGAAFVFYVAENGTAMCVSVESDGQAGIVARPGPRLPPGVQGDRIQALAAGVSTSGRQPRPQVGVLSSNGSVEYSLFFSFYINSSWSSPELQTVLVPPLPPNQQPSIPQSLTLADAYPVTTTVAPLPAATADPSQQSAAYNESLLGDVNIAQIFVPTPGGQSTGYTLFGFWVNGTNLAAYTTKNIGLSGAPKSTFPFPRLAGTTRQNGSGNVYLYHQINGTTMAEDVYSTTGGFFTSDYFDISFS